MKKALLVSAILLFQFTSWSQDLRKDKSMGEEGLTMVKEQLGIYPFEALDTVLQRIGKNLVSKLDKPLFDYEFYLVDSPEPNAFALPGGKIFVTRGLLILPLSEDELAGVIGHEIIHSNNRHSIKQKNNSVWGTLIAIPGLIIGGILPGPVGQAVASPFLLGNQLLTSSYSRGHEKEADKYGIELAAKAGYDPLELAHILDRLKKEAEYLTGEEEEQSYFASHPYTPNRIAVIEKNGQKYVTSPTGFKLQQDKFLPLFDELLLSENPKNGFVMDSVFYHPTKLLQMDLHGGWENIITPTTFALANKERDALLSLSVLPDTTSSSKHLKNIEKSMLNEMRLSPSKKENLEWHGYDGGMLEFISTSSAEKVKLQIFAIDYEKGEMIQLMAMFKASAENQVNALLKSANVLGKNELPSPEIKKLHILKASKDESLKDLIIRFNASESEALISIINGKGLNETVKTGDYVKIITKELQRF